MTEDSSPPEIAPTEPMTQPQGVTHDSPEPEGAPKETQTDQMEGSEPLAPEPEPVASVPEPTLTPAPQVPSAPTVVTTVTHGVRELLAKAQAAIQIRKRKKQEKILELFAKKASIMNDDVEKLLHVSDATATRYLSALVKEGKIKRVGKTGKAVEYTRI